MSLSKYYSIFFLSDGYDVTNGMVYPPRKISAYQFEILMEDYITNSKIGKFIGLVDPNCKLRDICAFITNFSYDEKEKIFKLLIQFNTNKNGIIIENDLKNNSYFVKPIFEYDIDENNNIKNIVICGFAIERTEKPNNSNFMGKIIVRG